MQSRNIRFQQSLLCRPVVEELRSSRILEDPVLKRELVSAISFVG